VYVIARSVIRSWNNVLPILWATVLGVVGVSAFAFYQFVTASGPDSFLVGGAIRVYGTFGTPNTLAAYLEFSTPALLILGLFGRRESVRNHVGNVLWAASLFSTAIGLIVLVLTQSRGGAVGMVAALVLVAFLIPRRVLVPSALIGIVATVLFMLTPAGDAQFQRFSRGLRDDPSEVSLEHRDALGRGSLWGAAIRMIEDEPLTGIGAGEYDYHYREYVPEWIDRFPRGQAHNGWLQMGAQAGVPGMLAFTFWLVASIVALAGAARRASDEIGHLLAWGALAVMLAFTLHSLVDYLNVLSLSIQLSAITAMGLALAPDPLRSVQRKRSPLDAQAASVRSGIAI
jgi:O-antigen ligase